MSFSAHDFFFAVNGKLGLVVVFDVVMTRRKATHDDSVAKSLFAVLFVSVQKLMSVNNAAEYVPGTRTCTSTGTPMFECPSLPGGKKFKLFVRIED
jgi:uncharacterized membrane protein YecN with MAPEG domain